MQHGYRESLVNVLYIHTSYDVSPGNLLYSVVNFRFSVMTTVLFFYNNVWSVNLDTCTCTIITEEYSMLNCERYLRPPQQSKIRSNNNLPLDTPILLGKRFFLRYVSGECICSGHCLQNVNC